MSDPVADPLVALINQAAPILIAVGPIVLGFLTFLVQIIVLRNQAKTAAKVEKIESHTNGMRSALEKSAYDRGASDEKIGEAQPKAEAP